MSPIPTGTITFLFTDIEGSTKLWEQNPKAMREALARHDDLLRQAIESRHGYVFKTVGDAFCAAFPTALDALKAALDAHLALQTQDWGEIGSIRVRMGLHTGEAQQRENDYFGQTLNRVARLQGVGHGQQTLLSQSAYALVVNALPENTRIQDMGLHRLKDLTAPEHIYQLLHPSLPQEFPPLKSLDHLPNNLPQQLTSFIGREKEIADIKGLLQKTRLLTLTGSGGTGKTRLSLQAGADLIEEYPDGVWFVELASLSDPALVAQTVASAIHVREEPGPTLLDTLIISLREKSILLILDNCEHLLDAAAQLAETLLKRCPHVRILASSREGLGIGGEMKYRVPSLSLPEWNPALPLENLYNYESMRLLIERAVYQQPTFTVTERNAPVLVSICRRLDGIPLALELAAARVRSMPVEEINNRLDNRFRLLSGGSRTALPRQQTLRALMDWSYDLLNAQEKSLLARLSVFSGGLTLAAVEQVCVGESIGSEVSGAGADGARPPEPQRSTPIEEWEVVDLLVSLADKSLVVYEENAGGAARYRLLETIRQYAYDRLAESGEGFYWWSRHRDYYLALAEGAEAGLNSSDQAGWLDKLETEHDNLRQALRFCLDEPGGMAKGLRLGAAMPRFWWIRGHLSEGREYLRAVLSHPEAQEHTKTRAAALYGAGVLAWMQGDFKAARSEFDESAAIARELGDRYGLAASLHILGHVEYDEGNYAAAAALYEESVAIRREIDDSIGVASVLLDIGNVTYAQQDYGKARALYGESLAMLEALGNRQSMASALHNLGNVARAQKEDTEAKRFYEQGLAIQRELKDKRSIASSLNHLGEIACDQKDFAAAHSLLLESLTMRQELGDKPGIAFSLEAYARFAIANGQAERAARMLGAAAALREAIGSPLSPNERAENDLIMAAVRAALNAEAFAAAWERGRILTTEQAIVFALSKTQDIY